jgi:hypothetical protein
MVQACGTE